MATTVFWAVLGALIRGFRFESTGHLTMPLNSKCGSRKGEKELQFYSVEINVANHKLKSKFTFDLSELVSKRIRYIYHVDYL